MDEQNQRIKEFAELASKLSGQSTEMTEAYVIAVVSILKVTPNLHETILMMLDRALKIVQNV